jgi:hypothetical protein
MSIAMGLLQIGKISLCESDAVRWSIEVKSAGVRLASTVQVDRRRAPAAGPAASCGTITALRRVGRAKERLPATGCGRQVGRRKMGPHFEEQVTLETAVDRLFPAGTAYEY